MGEHFSVYKQQCILHGLKMAYAGWFTIGLCMLALANAVEVDMGTFGGRGEDGTPCVFPFDAYGATHYGCTRLKSDGKSLYDFHWCATTSSFSPGGPWKKCNIDDSATTGGRGGGPACTVPFTAYGQTHYGCTRLRSDGQSLYNYDWCALSDEFESGGKWGKCTPLN